MREDVIRLFEDIRDALTVFIRSQAVLPPDGTPFAPKIVPQPKPRGKLKGQPPPECLPPEEAPQEAQGSALDRVNDPEAIPGSEEPLEASQTPQEEKPKRRWIAALEPTQEELRVRAFLAFWNEELRFNFGGPKIARLGAAMAKLIRRRLKENPRLGDYLKEAKVNTWFKTSSGCNRLPWMLGTRNLEKILTGYYEHERVDRGVSSEPQAVPTTPELESSFENLTGIRIGGVDDPDAEGSDAGYEDPLRSLVDQPEGN